MSASPAEPAVAGEPVLVTDREDLARERDKLSGRVGVVMTLGALHDGHAALLRTAREQCDHVVVTIFVNPLQFGPSEDFDRYPRTLDADLALCAEAGVDVVFAPDRDTVYPGGEPAVRVDPGPLGAILEGASRPGFFHGVLTVVCKLLRLTRADVTFFGEKDYQQLTLVRQLVRDLELGVEVVAVPTVREPDGLARSSRNQYLSTVERTAALALSRALAAGAAAAHAGADPAAALAAARGLLDEAARRNPPVELDYLVLVDPDFCPPTVGEARLLVAARVGVTRLIDNTAVVLPGGAAAAGTVGESQ